MAANRQKRFRDSDDGAELGPGRQCIVAREVRDPDDLIRFALAPDGALVADLERRLPGRGVWVSCCRETLEKAIKTKAFSKSLKTAVSPDLDLPGRLDNMLLRRVIDGLALANKAGRTVAGFQQVESTLEKGKVRVLLHGQDAAADGCLKLDRKFKAIQRDCGEEAPIVAILTIEEMSLAMGRPNVVHAALISGGLSERFLREAGRLERYRAPAAVSGHVFSEVNSEGSTDA